MYLDKTKGAKRRDTDFHFVEAHGLLCASVIGKTPGIFDGALCEPDEALTWRLRTEAAEAKLKERQNR